MSQPSQASAVRLVLIDDDSGLLAVLDRRLAALRWDRQVLGYAAAVRKAGSTDSAAVVAAMTGMTFDTAKGPVTFRKDDNQAICDVNFVRFEATDAEPGWKVAEFVRVPGADVIEPPTPGQPLAYRVKG